MAKNSEINWLYIISIKEFQNNLNLNLLKEISMISKLMREKLKPILFKNLATRAKFMKLGSNVIAISYDDKCNYPDNIINTLREENSNLIEDSLNNYIISLNDIKKYCISFYLKCNHKAGYYLYPLINLFNSLSELKIESCDIPFDMFANIGTTFPNLNRLQLERVDLIKSTTDVISEKDITFPLNLIYLKIFQIQLITTTSLSNPFEYLLNKKVIPDSIEDFTLLKIPIPTLKRLDYMPMDEESRGLEEFLEINPNIEFLLTRGYNLDMGSSLNSLKNLDINENINFDNIDQAFILNNINSLRLLTSDINYSENIRMLCQLCPNVAKLSIRFLGTMPNFQPIIDKYLAPTLSNLFSLKTLILINVRINMSDQILDFTKFAQIEKLKVRINWGSVLNIKFDSCKNLKRVELKSFDDRFTDEFKRRFNHYNNWKFKFSERTVKGYKI